MAAVNSNGEIGPLSEVASAATPAEDSGIKAILRLGFESGDPVTGYEWGGAQYDKIISDQDPRLIAVDKNRG